jgi:hypothetical protein
MPLKAPAAAGCPQAVDGLNGKVDGLGGTFARDSVYGASGSTSTSLGCAIGAQLDASALDFNNRFLGLVGGHLFWRDPSVGLLGIYGSYSRWSQFTGLTTAHVGPEAEWYMGRWTLQGVAGVERGNSAIGTIGTVTQTYANPTRFFDQVHLDYYPNDNWQLSVGHTYLSGKNALTLGSEWGIPMQRGIMSSLFVQASIGENALDGVWGGLRIYFGQRDKTLIRRHREDDPINWSIDAGMSNTGGNTPSVTNTPTTPPCLPPNTLVAGVCQPPT